MDNLTEKVKAWIDAGEFRIAPEDELEVLPVEHIEDPKIKVVVTKDGMNVVGYLDEREREPKFLPQTTDVEKFLTVKCPRCQHKWVSKHPFPEVCPLCKTRIDW